MNRKIIGMGYCWGFFSTIAFLGGIIIVIYAINEWEPFETIWIGLAFMIISFPFCVYFLTPRKVLISDLGIEYIKGKKTKFNAKWYDIIEIRNGIGEFRGPGPTVTIVDRNNNNVTITGSYDIPNKYIEEIFLIVVEKINNTKIIDSNKWISTNNTSDIITPSRKY